MTSAEIRQSFLDFFREKQHTIVPSSSLLPDAPNLLFTNAGMNQFVPIFLGQQRPSFDPPRAADTQKCIRAGGKHNDLEDVGLDTYHHTFFEMLGNWSFGDYFKKEAIEWAWELVVRRWKFPPERLYATVYQPGPNEPSEFDQEAHDHWARLLRRGRASIPRSHRQRQQERQFLDDGRHRPVRAVLGIARRSHAQLATRGGSLVNAGDPRCIEIWNLVFIQFNANPDGTLLSPAPAPRRYRDGFRARDRDHPGHEKFHRFHRHDLELRDRRFPPDLRRDRKTERQRIRQHLAKAWRPRARPSRKRSISPFVSSPITSALSVSRSPTASSRAMKDAATSSAGSCAAPSAMGGR